MKIIPVKLLKMKIKSGYDNIAGAANSDSQIEEDVPQNIESIDEKQNPWP